MICENCTACFQAFLGTAARLDHLDHHNSGSRAGTNVLGGHLGKRQAYTFHTLPWKSECRLLMVSRYSSQFSQLMHAPASFPDEYVFPSTHGSQTMGVSGLWTELHCTERPRPWGHLTQAWHLTAPLVELYIAILSPWQGDTNLEKDIWEWSMNIDQGMFTTNTKTIGAQKTTLSMTCNARYIF